MVYRRSLQEMEGDNKVGNARSLNAKVCPLAAANPQQKNSDCLAEACACYVKMNKPRVLHIGGIAVADEKFYLRYRGCGLVTHIPWDLVKKDIDQTTLQTNSGNKE
jgi:hypothetical protein